jgi:hypothetical protein
MRKHEHFGNARAVRKLLENARRAMSLRLTDTTHTGPFTDEELSLITGADVSTAVQWLTNDESRGDISGSENRSGKVSNPGYA